MTATTTDVWASGEGYESYVGRWSRLVAREFLRWLDVPPGARWLDVGCGTGTITQLVLDGAAPATVGAVDRSPSFIAFARNRVRDPRASFSVADAQALPHATGRIDAAVSGLVLNFVPQPDAAVAEMRRVVRDGGVVAVYVWDYAQGMQLMRVFWDTAVALDPRALERDEAPRFPICDPVALATLFRDAGLLGVESRAIDVPTRFRDFDDYWRPFLSGQGPAPSYAMSLSDERRGELRERIRAALPIAADGSIDLVARAWAVRGNVTGAAGTG
ncbi:MAG TPA: class I SAM-dependent methyltransferase [Gemmatimonadaceae bacterium]|jgi:SAM-dependent methyltransferase|nr:class I SAM-dependent methyltransferase [Gemmatimonadaceae bacterium]